MFPEYITKGTNHFLNGEQTKFTSNYCSQMSTVRLFQTLLVILIFIDLQVIKFLVLISTPVFSGFHPVVICHNSTILSSK